MHPERLRIFRKGDPVPGRSHVVYWMQRSQRAEDNFALEYAVSVANRVGLAPAVFFFLMPEKFGGNYRNLVFMFEGLKETAEKLRRRGIAFRFIRINSPEEVSSFLENSAFTVTDYGYLPFMRRWRSMVAEKLDHPFHAVEDDVVVPVEAASFKEEYSAGTFRPRINRRREEFMEDTETVKVLYPDLNPKKLPESNFDFSTPEKAASEAAGDVFPGTSLFSGGTDAGKNRFRDFLKKKIVFFGRDRNSPGLEGSSGISPYLHFGQISPVWCALEAKKQAGGEAEPFLEELIVRRELAVNLAFYNGENIKNLKSLPRWASDTLAVHNKDVRPYLYSLEELEKGKTHDVYWNACQKEMVFTGKMQGYMRMYWCKKIMEWTPNPGTALKYAIFLNDRYELDGRDPAGYAGILWCFGKHDRAWKERPVFGKTRYMSAEGLRRKFDMDTYVGRIGLMEAGIHENSLS